MSNDVTLTALKAAPQDKKIQFLRDLRLNPDEAEALLYNWSAWARKEQMPPKRPGWLIWFVKAGRGWGKMLCNKTPIPTPSGWTRLDHIEIGDEVFDESGRICRVTNTFDDATPDECFRMTFSDGQIIDACGDHQWVTWTHAERKAFLRSPYEDSTQFPDEWPEWRLKRKIGMAFLDEAVVNKAIKMHQGGLSERKIAVELGVSRRALTRHLKDGQFIAKKEKVCNDSPGPQIRDTRSIFETMTYGKRDDLNHCIPTAAPLETPEIDLPVDPYVLGYWLGDGSRYDGTFTCEADSDDQVHLMGQIELAGFKATRHADPQNVGAIGLMVKLRSIGALKTKEIPYYYRRSSTSQRLALLRGLMDSDGYADHKSSNVEFCSVTPYLRDLVFELATSLGQKPRIYEGRSMLNGVDHGPKYRVCWTPIKLSPFLLERKTNRLKFGMSQSLRNHHRMIVSCERIESKPMRCLTVDGKHSMFLAGEGMIPTHNTRTASEFIKAEVEAGNAIRIGLGGADPQEIRKTMLEGESGLISIYPEGHPNKPKYIANKKEVHWPCGARAYLFSGEIPEKPRGDQFDLVWCDELAAWKYPDQVWANLQFCRRLTGPNGHSSRIVVTTTPKPLRVIRSIMKNPTAVITGGSSYDNINNLDASYKEIISQYEGTRIGRQEIDGDILDEDEDALWKRSKIDKDRISPEDVPTLRRIVVSIDPMASKKGAEKRKIWKPESGIIVAGVGEDGHGYMLKDLSFTSSPSEWATAAIEAFHDYEANAIVLETNQGGDMAEEAISLKDPSIKIIRVWAKDGKWTRAEPVAMLHEQGKIHHVGTFGGLEDQLCNWSGKAREPSPDRLDAYVHAFTDLMIGTTPAPARMALSGATKKSYWGQV